MTGCERGVGRGTGLFPGETATEENREARWRDGDGNGCLITRGGSNGGWSAFTRSRTGLTGGDGRYQRNSQKHPLPIIQSGRSETLSSVELVKAVAEEGGNEVSEREHGLPDGNDLELLFDREPLDGD